MMKKTLFIYLAVLSDTKVMDDKFKKGVTYWPAFEKIADSWLVRISWGVCYFLFYYHFATQWWMYLLLPIHFLMGPVHGAIINWFAHKYGYVNFKVGDTAKNLFLLDFLMMGEGYHNNHHKFGGRANFGIKWFEIDFTFPIIYVLNLVGVIHLKKDNDLKYM
jgi:stearoyl-CoA desaturase (delta-9 desaturase)